MSYRVTFHPAVTRDLDTIARRLLPAAGPRSTARVIETLRDAARSLSDTPHRGTLRHDILPGLRAIPAGRRGVICFTVNDETRTVLVHLLAWGGTDWQARVPTRPAP